MNRTLAVLLTGILIGVGFTLAQRTTVSAQDKAYKIGVVNLKLVGARYEKRKDKFKDLQKQMETLQKGVDEKRTMIQKAREDYEAKKRTLDTEQIAALELKINSDIADYEAELKKGQLKVDSTEALIFSEVMKDIYQAVEALAAEGNYHAVFNSVDGPAAPVLYSHNSIDLTSKVLERLNNP